MVKRVSIPRIITTIIGGNVIMEKKNGKVKKSGNVSVSSENVNISVSSSDTPEFCVRAKDGTLLATTVTKDRADNIRTILFKRDSRFSDVKRFVPKNNIEKEFAKNMLR